MKILKAVLLLSAFLSVVLRLFSYENSSFLSEVTVKYLNIAALASMLICIITALIWAIKLKKEEKAKKENTDEE